MKVIREIESKAQEIATYKSNVRREVEEIQNSNDLTVGAKQRLLSEARPKVQEQFDRLKSGYLEAVEAARRELYQDAFGYRPGLRETPGAREHYGRLLNEVAGKSTAAIEKMLQNAALAGDTLAAQAILKECHEQNYHDLAAKCLEAFPGLQSRYESLLEFEAAYGARRSPERKLEERMLLSYPKF
jgi:hypothetical protein